MLFTAELRTKNLFYPSRGIHVFSFNLLRDTLPRVVSQFTPLHFSLVNFFIIMGMKAKVLKEGEECEAAGRAMAELTRKEDVTNLISFERCPLPSLTGFTNLTNSGPKYRLQVRKYVRDSGTVYFLQEKNY